MRKVEILKGKEITKEKVARIRKIAKKRYDTPIYESTFWDVTTLESLSEVHGINPDDEILILGSDWFLCYWFSKDTVEFLEWVALNIPSTKVKQTIEMMKELKNILLEHSDKKFIASMRHNGSYPFYLSMLKKGYFNEEYHSIDFDICGGDAPEELEDIDRNYLTLEDFLKSEEASAHPELLTYIMHDLVFNVSDSFVEHYKKR